VTSASNGTDTLVVWSKPSDLRVQAQFYSNGALQGTPLLLSETSAGYPAPVAWDGENFWVVWESDDEEHRLDGRSVSADGTLGPATRLLDEESLAPSIASDGNGHFILSYYQYSENSRTRRIQSRIVDVNGTAPSGGVGGAPAVGAGGSGDGGDPEQGGETNTDTGGRSATGGGPSAGNNGSGEGGRAGGTGSAATSGETGASGASSANDSSSGSSGCALTRSADDRNPVPVFLLGLGLALALRRRAPR
jgi:MYXO-CTERM domain-containing protein